MSSDGISCVYAGQPAGAPFLLALPPASAEIRLPSELLKLNVRASTPWTPWGNGMATQASWSIILQNPALLQP